LPGSQAYRRLQGAPHPGHVEIDKSFVSNPEGGPELVIGRKALHVRDGRTIDKR
jgi:hypothetical protein